MKSKHLLLLILIPLSEIKAIFYNSDLRVSWYLFSDKKRYLCNVVEDYSNIIIFGIVFYFLTCQKNDIQTRNICAFLLILNILDGLHLGLMDMHGFIMLKLILAYGIYYTWSKLKTSY